MFYHVGNDLVNVRTGLPRKIRYNLMKESGFRCANPGCTNYRTHIHHIRQWVIYRTHNEEYMIALCPSCHDEVHHGDLKISDETLIAWKKIQRKKVANDQIYVEPNVPSKLLIGSIAVTGQKGAIPFDLSDNNKLGFRLEDDDIFLVNLSVTTLQGKEVIRIVNNHIKYFVDEPVKYIRRTGKYRLFSPLSPEYIQPWALEKIRKHVPDYAKDGELTLLDIEVMKPGVVKVKGIWAEKNKTIIITDETISFITPDGERLSSFSGEGEKSVLDWKGSINETMFNF